MPPAPAAADRADIEKFLRLLWPEGPGRLYLCVWHLSGESRWFGGLTNEEASLAAITQAADYIASKPVNCYIGMCLADADHGPHHRLSRKENRLAFAAPGLWMDVDVKGPGHKSDNLPASIAQAMDILHAAGLSRFLPTFTVATGGGPRSGGIAKMNNGATTAPFGSIENLPGFSIRKRQVPSFTTG